MATEATMDAIETVIDVIEETPRLVKNNWGLVIGVGVIAGSSAFYAGYRVATKKLSTKFDEVMAEELKKTREFYGRLHKKDEFETPGDAVAALVPEEEAEALVTSQQAADLITKYHGRPLKEITTTVEKKQSPQQEPKVTVEVNVFDNEATAWDIDQEMSKRAANPQDPYVINEEEFLEAEPGYNQVQLTYYGEDDVLIDDKDQPVDPYDEVVGIDNMNRFGHGTSDPNTVYIRNDRLEMDFEVTLSSGSYAKEVLGFIEHSYSRRPRKFREDD